VSVVCIFIKKETVSFLFFRRLLLVKRLLKGQQRDGLLLEAEDGIRTRDSLLGRQVVSKTASTCCKSASQAD
jgi:hypothetical protein